MGILSSILKAFPRRRTAATATIRAPPTFDSTPGHSQTSAEHLGGTVVVPTAPSLTATDPAVNMSMAKTEMTPQQGGQHLEEHHKSLTIARPNKRRQDGEPINDIEMHLAVSTALDMVDLDLVTTTDPTLDNTVSAAHLEQNRLFDMPEIVRSIAEFLDKSSLAVCCRVSRIWSTLCTPLLWRHIVDKHWRDSRFCRSIQHQARFIRSLKCEDWTDYEELLLCDFPRLKSISLYGSKDPMTTKEKILDKVRPTLSSLVLSAVSPDLLSDTTLTSVQGLQQLTTLKLLNLTIQQDQLTKIFLYCHNLEFLSLTRVLFQDDTQDFFTHSQKSLVKSEAWTKRGATRIKYLAFKEVAITSEYLEILVRVCPGLLELSVARNEGLQISLECVMILKRSCPSLYALDVGSCKQLDKGTFRLLFVSFPFLTVINLSGTTIMDRELLLVAENCKELLRLDIQYCTSITSKGLHQFLSNCGPSLRHLESSGVIMDPTAIDSNPWTCTSLQILFVDVGLFATTDVTLPAAAKVPAQTSLDEAVPKTAIVQAETAENLAHHQKRSLDVRTGVETEAQSSSSSSSTMTTATAMATSTTAIATEASEQSLNRQEQHQQQQDQCQQQHPLHPLQNLHEVQYLGLMGGSPKLTAARPSTLLRGLSSVKRLHILGLYQSFKKEDLQWLLDSFPELCRIDAEHYNISDDLIAWLSTAYPEVRVYRKESDYKRH